LLLWLFHGDLLHAGDKLLLMLLLLRLIVLLPAKEVVEEAPVLHLHLLCSLATLVALRVPLILHDRSMDSAKASRELK
ncbi:hypothetical protein L9G15_26060, partial [Shewanella sp. A3A]|nr:hypothetical protein [Shewanella ferrihydritica]